MSLVSIVTPTFPGREQLLINRCVRSVQKQNYFWDLEHIIVSDRNRALPIFEPLTYYRSDDEGYEYTYAIKTVQINESWRNPVSFLPHFSK
jgi:hypothetical protein